MLTEQLRKPVTTAETCATGNLVRGQVRIYKHVTGFLKTDTQNELSWRHADFLLEAAQEIALAHRGILRGIRNRYTVFTADAQLMRRRTNEVACPRFARIEYG